MGTYWAAKWLAPPERPPEFWQAIMQGAFDEVVRQMSAWSESSDLTRFNRAPAGTWHVLPAEFFTVLQRALAIARETDGAYDPTVGEFIDLIGFGPSGPEVEINAAPLEAARARFGWTRLTLDPDSRRAFQPGCLSVDLSSIAKGFAVDLACERLIAAGLDNFLLEVGGEIRGRGCKPDGQPWWCWVERPPVSPGQKPLPETVVALCDCALATSGDYRRQREYRGRRHTQIIDPRTGVNEVGALSSVSVLAANCMDADGYATALFVLGVEAGMAFAEKRGLAALFVWQTPEGLKECWTSAWAAMLE